MSSNDDNLPLITFNSLYNLIREEKKNKPLQNLPENFYEALEKFLENKKKEIESLEKEKNIDENKLKKEKNILKNSLKISDDLMAIRCLKISDIAIKNKFYGQEVLDSSVIIIPKEREFYNQIQKGLNSFKF